MIVCRPATIDDRVFILSNWVSSFRKSPWAGQVSFADFHNVHWPQFERILTRPHCTTLVAEDELLLGFIAADNHTKPPLVFYVDVKQQYRRRGIATQLFRSVGIDPRLPFDYAFKTEKVEQLARKIPQAHYQHTLARFPEGQGHRK